jgi:regulator of sirC expression with transglutaminase-like and TPR domain
VSRTPDIVLFEHVVDREDEEIDLALAGLLVGQWDHPNLDVAHYLAEIDRIADTARRILEHEQGDHRILRALNRTLFEHLGFRGNHDDYYDPKNSFLSDVLDRRLGIPITLSIVYLEVGRRLGLEISGLSFPGHFLVRCEDRDGIVVLDAYHQGVTLDADDLEDRLQRVLGDGAELDDSYLEPASKRQIIGRVLSNLARIYRRDGDTLRELEVYERLAIVEPHDRQVARELDKLRARSAEMN